MNYVLFDTPESWGHLLPLTYTRPIAEIRCGIFTNTEKWQKRLQANVSWFTKPYLQKKYPFDKAKANIFINGALCPNVELVNAAKELMPDTGISKNGIPLIFNAASVPEWGYWEAFLEKNIGWIEYEGIPTLIKYPWHIFIYNRAEIISDFELLPAEKNVGVSDVHTKTYAPENIYVEEGATLTACVLNAQHGPIYIGKNAQVQEGALIRGAFALCEQSVVNMGAKIRGDVTIGPHSKVGGEVSNSVIFGYSNKAHDGFLGNSVLGEWCNIGADTNTSNLKNNYSLVKMWNYKANDFIDTHLQFCGLVMADHAKSSINTMFNTGTVVGVSANVFGNGFPPKYIPSFAWGGSEGLTKYELEKALEVAAKMMERRGLTLNPADIEILKYVNGLQAI